MASVKKTIFHYTDYRNYLFDTYRQMKSKRTACSHRYIEQHVGISQGYFSRILKGEKNISDGVIMKFVQFLKLSHNEGKFFENLVKFSQADDQTIKNLYYSRMMALASPTVIPLAREQFTYFNELHHVAVRALVEMIPISDTADLDMAGKLLHPPVSASKFRDSLQLLEKLKLIAKNGEGLYQVTDTIVSSGNHPGNMMIRNFLQNSLKRAADALSTVPEKERMASTMTVSVSSRTYEQMIELLTATRQEINKLVEQDSDPSRIYQLSMNLVPISQQINKDVPHA